MTPEKRTQLKDLRKKLANLPPEARTELESRALIATVEGRVLSAHNTIMLYFQAGMSGRTPSVVGGYQQWRKAGKQVKRGEHGYTIFFPVGPKAEDSEDSDAVTAETFHTATVFDISQVEEKEMAEVS